MVVLTVAPGQSAGRSRQLIDGKPFTAKKNFVWTCNKNTKEQASNTSNAVAIMRITDLMA
jgi:hypothetical protein